MEAANLVFRCNLIIDLNLKQGDPSGSGSRQRSCHVDPDNSGEKSTNSGVGFIDF